MLELRLAKQVAPNVVLKLRGPVPADGVADMAFLVRARVDIYFHQPRFGVVDVLRHPVGAYQNFGVFVLSHGKSPFG
jgi:hypothetical protein